MVYSRMQNTVYTLDKLAKKFKISGIPTLILFDGKDGKVITNEARRKVVEDPNGEDFPWRP